MKTYNGMLALGIGLLIAAGYFADGKAVIPIVFLGVGIAVLLVWVYLVFVEGQVYYSDQRENTRYVRLAEILRSAPAEVRRTVELSMRAALRVWPELSKGPTKFLGDTDVPLGFVAEFLNKSNNTYPAEIGKWSDGQVWIENGIEFGACRYLAGQVLDFFEQMDWVRRPAGGPNGTRWSRPEIHPGIIKVALEIPVLQEIVNA